MMSERFCKDTLHAAGESIERCPKKNRAAYTVANLGALSWPSMTVVTLEALHRLVLGSCEEREAPGGADPSA